MTIDERLERYRRETAADIGASWIGTSDEAIAGLRRLQREHAEVLLLRTDLNDKARRMLKHVVRERQT